MLEIEVKFRVDDFAALEARLKEWQAEACAERQDADAYFQAPHRDFAKTDEAFRLRRIGSASFITYKGPKIDAATKTRLEIEVPLAEGVQPAEDFEKLVHALGFRPVAIVRKQRRVFELARDGFELEICLDQVEQVGHYVELEIVAEPNLLDQAKDVLLKTAAELGLAETERRSYLELLLERTKNSVKPT